MIYQPECVADSTTQPYPIAPTHACDFLGAQPARCAGSVAHGTVIVIRCLLHRMHRLCRLFGGKSDPFLRISRKTEATSGTTFVPVLQTAVIKNSSSTQWRHVHMPLARVCMGDMDTRLRIEVLILGLSLTLSPCSSPFHQPFSLCPAKICNICVWLHAQAAVKFSVSKMQSPSQTCPDNPST
jgi:hypothetical protein